MSHAIRTALFVLAAAAPLAASGQDYPAREIRSICNFSTGSGADIVVRYYSDKLAGLAGRPVVVENRTGVQGSLATEFVAHSKPDGYTIMITPASSTLAAARYMFKQLRFDPDKDFTPVTTLAKLSFAIAVDAKSPVRSVAELTEHLKKKPGHGAYATGSNTGQVTGELYKEMAGLSTTYVPYKETMSALSDTISGRVDFMTYDITFLVPQVRAGRVRILAVTSATRRAALPDVPTMQEAGFAGYDLAPWWGVVVPAGTPRPVVEKLAAWFNQITASDETRKFLENLATDPFPGSPESMSALIRTEIEQWGKYVRLAKIEPQ
ncbi:MAG TPA: tripartite tricarboxylate transporter substrate-binding protein [Burkholderiales bacterium]|jgi:tripartite-type tricarboxylate transporter receptor subunit TctC|nr:tripartite tricarboxylate transporter substrate-binding protein [Burkholderiales bacterium]